MKSKISPSDRAGLASEIAALAEATTAELKRRWRLLYDTDAPARISRDLLTRALAYRMQRLSGAGRAYLAKSARRGKKKIHGEPGREREIGSRSVQPQGANAQPYRNGLSPRRTASGSEAFQGDRMRR
jgi:Protein of unknown function (DUF2924)